MIVHHPEDGDFEDPNGAWLAKWGALIGVLVTIAVLTGSFIWSQSALRSDVDALIRQGRILEDQSAAIAADKAEMAKLRVDIENIRQRQIEMLATLRSFDEGGTKAFKVLEHDFHKSEGEIQELNNRCLDTGRAIDTLRTMVVETRLKLDHLIQALSPHAPAPSRP